MADVDRSALRAESVRAVMEALGCQEVENVQDGSMWCGKHGWTLVTLNGYCPAAAEAVDAAAAPYVAAFAAAEAEYDVDREFWLEGHEHDVADLSDLRAERDALAARLARVEDAAVEVRKKAKIANYNRREHIVDMPEADFVVAGVEGGWRGAADLIEAALADPATPTGGTDA